MKLRITTRNTLIRSVIKDAFNGEPRPLLGLIQWLHYDLHYPLHRIAGIAFRRFGVPQAVAYLNLKALMAIGRPSNDRPAVMH